MEEKDLIRKMNKNVNRRLIKIEDLTKFNNYVGEQDEHALKANDSEDGQKKEECSCCCKNECGFHDCEPCYSLCNEAKNTVETTYFGFGTAIELLKSGKMVARNGWNGKNMFLWLKPEATIKAEWCKDQILKKIAYEAGGEVSALGTICMKTADNRILTGWLASQTDMLSEDWFVVEE